MKRGWHMAMAPPSVYKRPLRNSDREHAYISNKAKQL